MEHRRQSQIQCRPKPAPMLKSYSNLTLNRGMCSPSRNGPSDEFVVYRREPFRDDCEPQYAVYQREDDWSLNRTSCPQKTTEVCPPPCDSLPTDFACPGCQCVLVCQKKNKIFDDLRSNNFFACVGNILTFIVAFFFFLSVLEYIIYHEIGEHPDPGPETKGRSFHTEQAPPETAGKEEVQSQFVPERDRKVIVKPDTKNKQRSEYRSRG